MQDLPYKLPPLSKAASKEAKDFEGAASDVDPTSASNISLGKACQKLPLVIQKIEATVGALQDLKEVVVSLKKLKAALSPTNI